MQKFLGLAIFMAVFGSVANAQDEASADDPDHKVRLQTHFHKPLLDSGVGVGGWVVLPDVIGMSTSTLFLIGPRYDGDGWWVEGLAGGIMTAGDPISHPWSLSGRFEFTPTALDAPLRLWGNLQLDDLMGDRIQPYVVLMVDYALMDEQIFLGLESENRLNWVDPMATGNAADPINDFSFGPHLMLPFGGLTVTPSLQFHPTDGVRNQFWLRVMYDFGPVSG